MLGKLYETFLFDYLSDNDPSFISESGIDVDEFDEAGKDSVYKENYYFRDNLQVPFVSKILAKPRIQESIIDFTGRFMDDHANQLSTAGPVYIFTFGQKESQFFYDMFGVSADQIIQLYDAMIKETYYGKISAFISGWVKNAPHKILLTAILMEAIQRGYDDIVTCCEYLWAFSEYPIIYREFWKTGVKEDVMNYTIEHLGSKYKVKQVKNLQELLKYDATSVVEFFSEALKVGADNTYIDLMQRMRNQIKSKMKNIAIAYYKNAEDNATQHNNVSTFDDGEIADQEGMTTNVAQVVDKTVGKFSTGDINSSIVRIAADGSQVDKGNLAGYLAQIYATKGNRMGKIVENIITSYFAKNPTNTSVGSGEFLSYGLSLYRSIGTSKDPLLKEIKDILNYWMYTVIDIKSQYQREATIINYTRAVFNYVILMINYYN